MPSASSRPHRSCAVVNSPQRVSVTISLGSARDMDDTLADHPLISAAVTDQRPSTASRMTAPMTSTA
jgi:hypothetical protein